MCIVRRLVMVPKSPDHATLPHMWGDSILSELAADLAVTDVLRRHGKISASQIINKGELSMAFYTKDNDGNVVEVVESRQVSLEEIQKHIDDWTAKKTEYLALTGQTDPSTPAAPAAPADPAPAAPVDQPAAPAAPSAPVDGSAPADGSQQLGTTNPDGSTNPAAPAADPNAVADPAAAADPTAQPPVFPQ